MNIRTPLRLAVGFCAGPTMTAMILSGCGSAQPPSANVATADVDQTRVKSRQAVRSWIDSAAAGKDLLYVSTYNARSVLVYTYPEGHLVGTLTGFNEATFGECTDLAGDVF